ncbi:hypothetical protein GC425_02825 [Corynebacterium sp. zg254]|uniref:Uncharacterized protein n=1 Tax=Corynebacterium zhongnanshanii TaxID=2768834 RepID=A0ABQ6VFC2_9CORY|nr:MULTISPECIES: hypothetical protein [Corynebacterium]KAB3523099.1 hypothetical protein F8377_02800 [Corynebacterium zhongnanshanii]MCR5913803.1 hypothetical protein [Corynebacterium sp. zg254]
MRFRKTFIATALVATTITTPSFATAIEADQQSNSTISIEDGKQVAKPISPEQRSTIKSAVNNGDLKVQTDNSNLYYDGAKASVNSKGDTLVMIPIKNEGMEYSNLSVILSSSGDIANYSESHFIEKTQTSGHVTAWNNGNKVKDQEVSAPQDATTAARSVGDAVSELNRCLSAAGIPAWVVAAATAVCSFGSLPGYIACLTAAGVGGGTAGYCGASAWHKL